MSTKGNELRKMGHDHDHGRAAFAAIAATRCGEECGANGG